MKKLIILSLIIVSVGFGTTIEEIDIILSKLNSFSSVLIQSSFTPMGETIDTGKIHFDRPNAMMNLSGQNFIVNNGKLYSWYDGDDAGFLFESNEMGIFSTTPIAKFSQNYEISIADSIIDSQNCYFIFGKSKEDANILQWSLFIEKNNTTPVLVEWEEISGTLNRIKFADFAKTTPPAVVFTIPENIHFEGDI